MRSRSLIQQLADEFYTPEFAARLTQLKFECYQAEQSGGDLTLDEMADRLDLPPAIVELVLAWNVASANAHHIIDAMAAGQRAHASEARH